MNVFRRGVAACLAAAAVVVSAITVKAAVPSFKDFFGTNGIVIRTNGNVVQVDGDALARLTNFTGSGGITVTTNPANGGVNIDGSSLAQVLTNSAFASLTFISSADVIPGNTNGSIVRYDSWTTNNIMTNSDVGSGGVWANGVRILSPGYYYVLCEANFKDNSYTFTTNTVEYVDFLLLTNGVHDTRFYNRVSLLQTNSAWSNRFDRYFTTLGAVTYLASNDAVTFSTVRTPGTNYITQAVSRMSVFSLGSGGSTIISGGGDVTTAQLNTASNAIYRAKIDNLNGNGTNTALFGVTQLGDGNNSGRTTVSNALVIPSGRTNSPLRLNHTNAAVSMTHIPLEGQFFFYDSFDREQTTTNLGTSASGHTWLQYNVRDGVPSAPQVQMTNGYFTLTSAVQSATYQSFSNSFGISNMTRWGGIVEFPTNTAVVGNGYENEATLLLIDRADLTGGAFAHLGFTRSTFGIGYSLITNIFYTNLPVAFPLDAKITVDVQSAGDTMQVHYGPYLFTFRDTILSEVTDKKVSMWEIIGSDTNGVLARWHSVYADWAEPRMALYGNDEIVLRQSAGGAMANQVEYFKSASNSVEVIAGANTTVTPSSSGFRQRFSVASTGGAGTVDPVTNRFAGGNVFTNLGNLRQEGTALFLNPVQIDGAVTFNDTADFNNDITIDGLATFSRNSLYTTTNTGTATNITVDLGYAAYISMQPSNTPTIAFVNVPASGSSAREWWIDVLWTNASGTIVWPSVIDMRGSTPAVVMGITNIYHLRWNGTNFYMGGQQELFTGTGAIVASNAPSIFNQVTKGYQEFEVTPVFPNAVLTNFWVDFAYAEQVIDATNNVHFMMSTNAPTGARARTTVIRVNTFGASNRIISFATNNFTLVGGSTNYVNALSNLFYEVVFKTHPTNATASVVGP